MTVAYKQVRGTRVRVIADADVSWHDATYYYAHQLGRGGIVGHQKAHVGIKGYGAAYDARVMPVDEAAALERMNQEIADLQRARQDWLDAHFNEWPIVTRDTAPRIVPGRPKSEAQAQLKAEGGTSKARIAAERSIIDRINRTLLQ